jgi:hypothetical protein
MTTQSNSVFLKNVLTKEEKAKFAAFFNLPVAVFERAIGVIDMHEYDDSTETHPHRDLMFHYAAHLSNDLHTLNKDFTPEICRGILTVRGIGIRQNGDSLSLYNPSYGFTKIQDMDRLPETPLFTAPDEELTIVYKPWICGALVRLTIDDNGDVNASTFRKISCRNSVFPGSRETFESMLLGDQDVFSNLDEFFSGPMKNKNYVHMFMLNNKALIIEPGVSLSSNNIYYVGTFDITDASHNSIATDITEEYIREKNTTASKPILFPSILTEEMVNETLQGEATNFVTVPPGSIRAANDYFRTLDPRYCLNMYKRQGSVIAHISGKLGSTVCRIMPISKRNAGIIMDGVPSPAKVFANLLAEYGQGTLLDKKPIIPVGFSLAQLEDIADKLYKFENVDIDSYEINHVSVPELILTAVIFSSPNHLVLDAISMFKGFGDNVIECAKFLYENRGKKDDEHGLELALTQSDYKKFDGFVNLNKSAKEYLIYNYKPCFYEKAKGKGKCIGDIVENGTEEHWHSKVCAEFNTNKKSKSLKSKQMNALLALVSNAPPEALFSLLQFKSKVEKTRAAFARTNAAAAIEEMNSSMEAAVDESEVDVPPTADV